MGTDIPPRFNGRTRHGPTLFQTAAPKCIHPRLLYALAPTAHSLKIRHWGLRLFVSAFWYEHLREPVYPTRFDLSSMVSPVEGAWSPDRGNLGIAEALISIGDDVQTAP